LAARSFRADDPGTSQAAKVPRHQRLADAEASCEQGHRLLALGDEDLHDAQAVHIAKRAVVALQLAKRGRAERAPLHHRSIPKRNFMGPAPENHKVSLWYAAVVQGST